MAGNSSPLPFSALAACMQSEEKSDFSWDEFGFLVEECGLVSPSREERPGEVLQWTVQLELGETEAGPRLGSQARRWLARLLRPSLAGLLVSDIEALYTKQRGQRLVSGWVEQLERESQVQVERPLLLVKWRQHTEKL